jgi:hypothetical protein
MAQQDLINVSGDLFQVMEHQKIEIKNLLNTLKHIESRAEECAVHEKGTCNECDSLRDIIYAARKAINFHSSVSSI